MSERLEQLLVIKANLEDLISGGLDFADMLEKINNAIKYEQEWNS